MKISAGKIQKYLKYTNTNIISIPEETEMKQFINSDFLTKVSKQKNGKDYL